VYIQKLVIAFPRANYGKPPGFLVMEAGPASMAASPPRRCAMFRHHGNLPPVLEAAGLMTFFVLLPIAALVFGILVLGFLASR
jgi:hypothetical protein